VEGDIEGDGVGSVLVEHPRMCWCDGRRLEGGVVERWCRVLWSVDPTANALLTDGRQRGVVKRRRRWCLVSASVNVLNAMVLKRRGVIEKEMVARCSGPVHPMNVSTVVAALRHGWELSKVSWCFADWRMQHRNLIATDLCKAEKLSAFCLLQVM
jgi:hypothetical protein